ncbi:hypothetical protein GCM10027187_64580 [Streptosporangium sandarakinum]
MAIEYLSDEQVARYGQFAGEPSPQELESFSGWTLRRWSGRGSSGARTTGRAGRFGMERRGERC